MEQEQNQEQMRTFQVEVGQDAGHLEVVMAVFWIDVENAECAYHIALSMAEDYDIEDAIVISIECQDKTFASC